MALDPLQSLNGAFSLLVVIIYTIVGLKIASKYFELKQRVFLLVGITWVGLASPWWPSSISWLIAIITGTNGLQSSPEIYFMIGNVLIPIFLLTWMIAFTDLLYKDKQAIILIGFVIYGILFEAVFFLFLFNDPALVGVMEGPTDVEYQSVMRFLLLSILVILGITGALFGRESLRSENPEIRLKGKLLILSIILFDVGAAMDSALQLTLPTLVIARIILLLSAVGFYGGFLLPKFMKTLLIKS
ncbi:MAG: hypothetical protein ACTSR8_17140 [Promethearchaeota archaeon]